jgi:hypothetical protein
VAVKDGELDGLYETVVANEQALFDRH